MTRFTPTRLLTLLLLGAATVSSGVLAAPTTSSMDSALSSTGATLGGVEHVNLAPRADDSIPANAIALQFRAARTDPEGFNVDVGKMLKSGSDILGILHHPDRPFGDTNRPEVRQALFNHDPNIRNLIRDILETSILVVASPHASPENVRRADLTFQAALAYLPTGDEKSTIELTMNNSRLHRPHSTATSAGQRQ
ncbi:hypothetical protein C8R42DRAFT_639560 [Lentinula raphanica]|nr:hypothetical protein C8R42DRAFT_639560 [Lentinula raphanica]